MICIIISYLLESKLSLNMACFHNIIKFNDNNINNINNAGNNNSNNNNNKNIKLWKASKSHSIKIDFSLNKRINAFYGIEIDIPNNLFKKQNNGIAYGFINKIERKRYFNSFNSKYYEFIDNSNYLSEKETINDINCICCDNPNKTLLYVKNNETNKLDLTKYLTLNAFTKYEIEIIISRDINVETFYSYNKTHASKFNSKLWFSVGMFNYIKYHQSWMPRITMLIGENDRIEIERKNLLAKKAKLVKDRQLLN